MDASKGAKILGNCRFNVTDETGFKLLAILRGKLKKRGWINIDDIVRRNRTCFQSV